MSAVGTRLALASLRSRGASFAATAVSVFLGTAVVLCFLTLLDTALADGVSAVDRETLVTMASVVGGWGLVLVLFSLASTLSIAVRRRAEEFGLLRTGGASRAQLRRMVTGETLVVSLGAAALGVLPGWLLGRWVLHLIRDAGMVAGTVEHRLGWIALSASAVVVLVSALGASGLAVRSLLRGTAVGTLQAARVERTRMPWWRWALAAVFLLAGANYSTLAVILGESSDDPYLAMSMAGPASIFWSLGLAMLAPVFLRAVGAMVSGLLARSGSSGWLAAYNTRRRWMRLSGILMPVVLFVGIGTGTLYLMSIENAATTVATPDGRTLALLNYVVVGMIAAFAAIMVVNTVVAVTADRRRELGQQRLAGASERQVRAMLLTEGGLIAVTGIVLGGLASLGTAIPYAVVKTDGWFPTTGAWIFPVVCAAALVVTLAATRVSGGRALRGRAVDAALAG